jgi:hypothetical protein
MLRSPRHQGTQVFSHTDIQVGHRPLALRAHAAVLTEKAAGNIPRLSSLACRLLTIQRTNTIRGNPSASERKAVAAITKFNLSFPTVHKWMYLVSKSFYLKNQNKNTCCFFLPSEIPSGGKEKSHRRLGLTGYLRSTHAPN